MHHVDVIFKTLKLVSAMENSNETAISPCSLSKLLNNAFSTIPQTAARQNHSFELDCQQCQTNQIKPKHKHEVGSHF